jgi:hypothetical protein
MRTLNGSQKVVLTESTLMQQLEYDSVLLNLETEQYFGLDEVGTRMLQVMLESPNLHEAYALLFAEYEVTPARLEEDMVRFLDELVDNRLVRVLSDGDIAE